MHHAIVVEVLDATGHLRDDAARVVLGEAVDLFDALKELAAAHAVARTEHPSTTSRRKRRPPGGRPHAPSLPCNADAQFHDEIVVFARFDKVDKLDNVGVVQPLVNGRLAQQVFALACVWSPRPVLARMRCTAVMSAEQVVCACAALTLARTCLVFMVALSVFLMATSWPLTLSMPRYTLLKAPLSAKSPQGRAGARREGGGAARQHAAVLHPPAPRRRTG